MEALVRTLASHAQHISDHLPRQTDITCAHNGLIERTLSSADAYLRDHDLCECRIIDRGAAQLALLAAQCPGDGRRPVVTGQAHSHATNSRSNSSA